MDTFPLIGRNREQLSNKRDRFIGCIGPGENRVKLGKLEFIRVVARESGSAFQLRDMRIERAVLMMWRAEKSQFCMGLLDNGVLKGTGKARLANAGLTADQDDLAVARFGLIPTRSSSSSSSSRPTSGVARERSASNRPTARFSETTRQARCGSANPFSGCAPRSSTSNSAPTCRRVLAAMTMVFGAAT